MADLALLDNQKPLSIVEKYNRVKLIVIGNLGVDHSEKIIARLQENMSDDRPLSSKLLDLSPDFSKKIQTLAISMVHKVIEYLKSHEDQLYEESPDRAFVRLIETILGKDGISSATSGIGIDEKGLQNHKPFMEDTLPFITESLNDNEIKRILGDWSQNINLKELLRISLDEEIDATSYKVIFESVIEEYCIRAGKNMPTPKQIDDLFRLYIDYLRDLSKRTYIETMDYVDDLIANIITTVIGFQMILRSMDMSM
ncbi:MAG: hypothetical protein ABI721_01210 [Candidatus Dojkabacteria bacterium]